MDTKQAITVLYSSQNSKISSIYDKNDEVQEALNVLISGFEYPDHSHKKIRQVLVEYFNQNRKPISLGQVVATRELATHCQEHEIPLLPYVAQHGNMQWGLVPLEDKLENDMALIVGGRLVSKYALPTGEFIYAITDFETEESPRTTTLMFTDQY